MGILEPVVAFLPNKDRYSKIYRIFIVVNTSVSWTQKRSQTPVQIHKTAISIAFQYSRIYQLFDRMYTEKSMLL